MTPLTIDSQLLELMASRICHDLISPVGAINNGIEFMEDDMGGDMTDAIELINMSAQSAAARLQVFRYAYGTGGRDATVKPEDIYKAFQAFLDGENKIRQDWDPLTTFTGLDRPEGFGKILMCGLFLMHEGLPKGGTIRVSHTMNAGKSVTTITGEGTDCGFRPQVDKALARTLDVSVIDPRLVHAAILGIMATQYDYSLTLNPTENGAVTLVLTVNIPES